MNTIYSDMSNVLEKSSLTLCKGQMRNYYKGYSVRIFSIKACSSGKSPACALEKTRSPFTFTSNTPPEPFSKVA